jgi:hypothetical protein
MLIPRTLSAPIAAAAVLVGLLLSAPAFAQAHNRNSSAGTASNGAPIGSPGSGAGSPEHPLGSNR